MERQDSAKQRQRAREELLLRFIEAYEEGNLEVFSAILEQAKIDPELDTLIWDVFPTYLREEEHLSSQEIERLASILQQAVTSKPERSSSLTLAGVAARVQVELTLHQELFTDPLAMRRALNTLVRSHDRLPPQLDLSHIQMIFFQHGLAVPPDFSSIFLRIAQSLQEKRSLQ